MKPILTISALLLLAVPAVAQTATPSSRFIVDQIAPDLATANAYTYRLYADGATTGQTIAMTCTGTASPFLCTSPVGPFTPGTHSVTMTAANSAGESQKSAALSFVMVIVPAVPGGLRIQ